MSNFSDLTDVIDSTTQSVGARIAEMQVKARTAGAPLTSENIIELANLQVDLTLARVLPALRSIMLEAVLMACSARTDEIIASIDGSSAKSH
jgi:hypothetical protein